MTTLHATASVISGTPLERQIELEHQAIADGIARYRQQADEAVRRGEGSLLKPAERLILHWIDRVAAAIYADQKAYREGKSDVGITVWGPLLCLVPADAGAVVAINHFLSSLLRSEERMGTPLRVLSHDVGEAWIAESHAQMMRETRQTRVSTKSGREYTASLLDILHARLRRVTPKAINWWAKRHLNDPIDGIRGRIHLGTRLIGIFMRECSAADYDAEFVPAIQQAMVRRGVKTHSVIRLTRAAQRIIETGHAARALLRPRYLPMVVPPMSRVEDPERAYVEIKTPFITRPTADSRAALAKADLHRICQRLAAIEATGMQVDPFVFSVADQLTKAGGGVCGLPIQEDQPMPRVPAGFNAQAPVGKRWADVKEEDVKAWRSAAVETFRVNLRRRSERADHMRRMLVADMFVNDEAIYFPKQMDFRGRAYSIPQSLNFEGPDISRGLLRLARAKKPGSRGMWRLQVHLANMYGVDKVSFDDRVAWASEHQREIEKSGERPLDCEFWRGAKKPWQFLQACRAVVDHETAARLIRQVDGTCNGLQVYAALGRDQAGAEAANLVWSDKPADPYMAVAARVGDRVRRDMRNGNRIAAMVVQFVDRDLCKPGVMLTFYGVTDYGRRSDMYELLGGKGIPAADMGEAVRYMANAVKEGVGSVCESSARIMAWIQVCARLFCSMDKPFQFTSPLGLPVVQRYRKHQKSEIITAMSRVTMVLDRTSSPLAVKKQADAAPPNFIHMLDQTHMFETGYACREKDIDFVPVHDNFGTHLATADALDYHTRDEFVKLHRPNLLMAYYDQFTEACPEAEFPLPPSHGTFDIEKVYDAPYFFN